ncbi:MAG TPA: hypothetical protein VGF22_08335 [Acidimicrobiales bacterium]
MDQHVSRRSLLAGAGAAAGAAALGIGVAAGPAAARPVPYEADLDPAANEPLVAGLAYQMVDAVAFTPRDFDNAWQRGVTNLGAELTTGGALVASINVPVGAVLKQVTLYYLSPPTSSGMTASVLRKLFSGPYEAVSALASLAAGTTLQSFTFGLDQTIDGNYTYALFVNTVDESQVVGGMRIGYIPPPQSFVALTGVPRYDSRTGAGKLAANEERVINVGVPAGARAAVLNLTVTETEAAGFVAVFAANIMWPGNSSVNWSVTGQTVANAVIAPVGPDGKIKVLGGVNKTHIVIDTQGYLP